MGPIQIFPFLFFFGKICMGPIQIFPFLFFFGKICMGPIQIFVGRNIISRLFKKTKN
jgi:hypothetical protein